MEANSIPTHKLDFLKKPEQLVLELINHDNGTTLHLRDIEFGKPKLNPPGSKRNSRVKVSATANAYLTGAVELKYNRVDFDYIPKTLSRVFLIDPTIITKISDLVPQIDSRYTLNLTPVDYVDGPIPAIGNIPDELDTLEILAGPDSLVFINKLTLQIERLGGILLSNVLNNTILNGLMYRPPAQLCGISTVC